MTKLHIIVPLGRSRRAAIRLKNADYFVKGICQAIGRGTKLDMSNLLVTALMTFINQVYHQAYAKF